MLKSWPIRAAFSIVLVFAVSCLPSSVDQDRQTGAATGMEEKHWVQGAQLREIMTALERDVRITWPQEMEKVDCPVGTSVRAAKMLEKACWLADGLAKTADRIPKAMSGVKMTEDNRRVFLTLADTLRMQAERLGKMAGTCNVDGMRNTLVAIDVTCSSCHERFRDIAGPLSPCE